MSATKYRYPGSRPFQDTPLDRRLFFGREHDQKRLLHALLAEDMIVLFAQAGMGKTSLLNAGIIHHLRQKNFLPLTVRFNDPSRSPQHVMYETMQYAGSSPVQEYDERMSLAAHLSLLEFGKVLLILDQFEEFFALHSSATRDKFITQLAELLRHQKHHLKILISIREEFFGQLQEMSHELPGILRNRIRLSALTREQAKEAIIRPAGLTDSTLTTAPFQYAPEAVDAMLDFLCKQRTKNGTGTTNEVEPFQLQLLCQHIEDSLPKTHEATYMVQAKDIGGDAGMRRILHTFYTRQLSKIVPFWRFLRRRHLRQLCEKGLINVSNRRLSLEEEDIRRRFNVSKELLAKLVNVRLLRADPRKGSMYYELSHDNLVAPIRQSLAKRSRRLNMLLIIGVILQIAWIVELQLEGSVAGALGRVSYCLGDYAGARAYYDQAIQRNPTRTDYYYKLGLALNKQGHYAEAMENFSKAITFDPDYLEAKMKLAEVYLISERFENSMILADEILQAVEMTPTGSILPEDILAMRFFIMTSLFCQGKQLQAVEEGQDLLEFYQSLPDDYERSWNYAGSENFIRSTSKLSTGQKHLLLQILTLFEIPKPEAGKVIEELETLLAKIGTE